MNFGQFSRNNKYISIPGKMSEIHLYVLLVSNSGEKVLKSIKSRGQIGPILYEEKGPLPMDWRTTMQANRFLTISRNADICVIPGNLSEIYLHACLFSNPLLEFNVVWI